MWRFVLAVWESLCRCEYMYVCTSVTPAPAGAAWAAVHVVVCSGTPQQRLCVMVGFVTLTLESQSQQTKHCIKILPTSLLCTKLLLDIILLNNKFVKYIFFNHMRYLGCVTASLLELWGPGWVAAELLGATSWWARTWHWLGVISLFCDSIFSGNVTFFFTLKSDALL